MALTAAVVRAIVDEPCLVFRNLRITVAYHRLNQELAQVYGADNAFWTGFATWTSEDVGRAIRGEWTDRSRPLRLVRAVHPRYAALSAEVAEAFSLGNTAVFDEVGAAFVGFVTALRSPDPGAALGRFLDALPDTTRGVDVVAPPVCLRDAFTAYADARDQGGRERARSIALGNLALAVVEQDRVEGPIATAFGIFASGHGTSSCLRRAVSRAVTELVLEVQMGPLVVRPGDGLPSGRVPADLGDLSADPRFVRFAALLGDRDLDADDWTDLHDRLVFIQALMTAIQQAPDFVGSCPLDEADCVAIEAGTPPDRFRGAVHRVGGKASP